MGILDLLFPINCLGCGTAGTYICNNCIWKLPKPVQTCPMCQKPSIDGETHIKCRKKLEIDGIYSLYSYKGVIRKAILKLKFNYASDVASELVGHLNTKIKKIAIFPGEAILVPVPLYWYKENVRGFNQSAVIGRQIADKMGWDFQEDLLLRRKLKKSQSVLKKEDRKENIRGVFVLKPNYKLQTTNYLLFDDIYTTGSTLREAAKVLKRRGAGKVWGLTIAK